MQAPNANMRRAFCVSDPSFVDRPASADLAAVVGGCRAGA